MVRTTSFVLALAFILCGPSIAGTYDSSLPGVGTFSWNGATTTSAN